VAELSPSITDEEVLQQANAHSAVLLTADKDFGDLVFRQGLVHSGVMLLRLAGLANVTKAEIVAEVCRDRTEELVGAFTSSRLARSAFDEKRELLWRVELQDSPDGLRPRVILSVRWRVPGRRPTSNNEVPKGRLVNRSPPRDGESERVGRFADVG
jgi:predicted nuclease of predicted toxin-antitoxin system